MYETVTFSVAEGIAQIRFNRPHRLNAVTQQLYDELGEALVEVERDSEVRGTTTLRKEML